MPAHTIETTYTLAIFRHGTYIADTPEAACKAALADENWESPRKDYDSSGEIHVTGIWAGENTAYAGSPISVPSQFDDPIQRRARHFEILLGPLKMMYHDARAARQPSLDWLAKSAWRLRGVKQFWPVLPILTRRSIHQSQAMSLHVCGKNMSAVR